MTSPRSHTLLTAVWIGLRAMRQYPGLALLFLVATLSQGLLQGLLIWGLRHVLLAFERDTVSASALLSGALLVFGLWFLRAFTTFGGEIVQARLAQRVEMASLQRLLAKLLRLSMRFFERTSQADLVMAAYQDMKGIRQMTLSVGTIALSLTRVAGLAAVAWMMSPTLALVGLVVLPLGMLPAYWLGVRLTRAAQLQRNATLTLHDSFLQTTAGIAVIKVNRAEERVLVRAREVAAILYRAMVRQAQSSSLARLLLETVGGIGLITVLVLGAREVSAGLLDWQALLSLLIAVMALYPPVVNLLNVYSQIRTLIPNLDRLDAIFGTPEEIQDSPDAQPLPSAPAAIELQDVSYAYDDALVLDSISATFHRGETVGIVGPSGAGKSTLIALLLRLYDPSRGRILYDGVDLRKIRRADVLDKCAIVLQEPFIFLDTIANNIRFARSGASQDEVAQAARAANIHEEIMRMPDGYETVLGRGSDGRGVSVGQKQRICIAAALLKNAPMLFLDEATSNLDSVSERAVQSAIERLMVGRTSFVIAHRLSTLRAVDRILVLDQGRMVGLGTHEELLRMCPLYQQLWRSQSFDRAAAPPRAVAAAVAEESPIV